MCGFAGFTDFSENLLEEKYLWSNLGKRMAKRISHRGPDDNGVVVNKNSVLAHARLSVMDPQLGKQPMSFIQNGFKFTIIYNGEIYNMGELRTDLIHKGYKFETNCDTEVLLKTYMEYGEKCAEMLNGIYAFVIDDELNEKIFLCRDRFGVKPFFYTFANNRLVFASEIKGLFEYSGINPIIDKNGLAEIFAIGPAKISGSGIFKDIHELKPATYAVFDKKGFTTKKYYNIKAYDIDMSYDDAVFHTCELLHDIAKRQLVADVPVCTFLSGGLDSSVITALAKVNIGSEKLHTYSFDYKDNTKFFTPTDYELSADEPWARKVSEILGTNHTTLICDTNSLYKSLFDAVIAKDLPGMADIDSSLLYFCKIVKQKHVVALCGECADEVFGGYPWFLNEKSDNFPWSRDMDFRNSMLIPELADELNIKDFSQNLYYNSLEKTPLIGNENETNKHWREMTYLNINWFMQTLLDRKDRCSMYSGLEVRVPYADHRLIEFIYNCPADYKFRNGVNKSILRDAAKGLLPDDILFRKKKPYPKTHNPEYENLLKYKFKHILSDSAQPIHKILSKESLEKLVNKSFDYGKPWFGQLMAGPQLIAYFLQLNYWLIHYNIYLDI